MTCKDCIHSEICLKQYSGLNEDMMFNECKKFKNKADFAEVVRCKDCQYYVAEYCARDIKGRTNMFYMTETDFCSYGERRDKE